MIVPPTDGREPSGTQAAPAETPGGRPPGLRRTFIVPFALGLLLLAAAATKGYDLAADPSAGQGSWAPRGVLVGVVEFELALSLWLLSGYRPGQARAVGVLTFVVFSLVNLSRALGGETSCGCFGRVRVHPWYTFCLDLAALAAILCWRPASPPIARVQRARLATGLVAFVAAGVPAGIAMGAYRPAASAGGEEVVEGRVALLEPERWTGRPFPLRAFVDIGDELLRGRWVVVLYRHDCLACQDEIPGYERAALAMAKVPGAPRVALVEVPPYGRADFLERSGATPYRAGALRDVKEWFVTTPSVLFLADGVVRPKADGEAWLRVYTRPAGVRAGEAGE